MNLLYEKQNVKDGVEIYIDLSVHLFISLRGFLKFLLKQ